MDFKEKTLVCVECGAEFVFIAGEQRFFADKGFDEPKRCKPCKLRKDLRFPPHVSTLEGRP
jgi:hypothetical protein